MRRREKVLEGKHCKLVPFWALKLVLAIVVVGGERIFWVGICRLRRKMKGDLKERENWLPFLLFLIVLVEDKTVLFFFFCVKMLLWKKQGFELQRMLGVESCG